MLRSVLVLTSVLLLAAAAGDASAAGPSGSWKGTMRSPDGGEFDIELNLDGTGSSWNGTLIEAQGDTLSLENLRVTATRISFTFRPEGGAIPANFTGGYIAADDRITGTFSLRGTSRFVKFERQDEADPLAAAAAAEPEEPMRVRHHHKLGLTGRVAYWPSLHLVVDETLTLNNLTAAEVNFDLALRFYVNDAFNVFVRGYRGGQGFTDEQGKLDGFADLGVGPDTYLKLDGFEFGIMGFLGNKIARDSRFNPYVTAAAGIVDWQLGVDGRGSEPVVVNRDPLEGSDWAGALGIGTEYELSDGIDLELEWLWRFFFTKDDGKWPDTDTTWKDTHAWALSLGLTVGFW